MPTFLGIGAPRCGTTWLYRNLRQHPEIWLPTLKELHYFDQRGRARFANRYYRAHLRRRLRRHLSRRSWRRGELRELSWDLHYFLRRRTTQWYARLFRPAPGQIAGEVTPAYSMLDSELVEEIRDLNPELKVIYLLRDPIERAWSGAVSELVLRRRRPLMSVPDEDFIRHFDRSGHVLRGDYLRTLTIWEGVFGRGRVFVGFMEQIQEDPRNLFTSLCRFLGVEDRGVMPDGVSRAINAAGGYRIPVPRRFERHLARQHLPQLQVLAQRFKDPVATWLERAEHVLSPAAETLREPKAPPADGRRTRESGLSHTRDESGAG